MVFWESLHYPPMNYGYPGLKVCRHRGDKVKVGDYEIYAGAGRDLMPDDMKNFDVIIPLAGASSWIWDGGFSGLVLAYPMEDGGGIKGPWKKFLNIVIGLLDEGKRVLVYCLGGHGRTGTFLASLIALLEQPEDPIDEIRKRYCKEAVETEEQAKAIFELLKKPLPKKYVKEFAIPTGFQKSIKKSKRINVLKKECGSSDLS